MDKTAQGEIIGEKWWATLRSRAASLTATACRAPFVHRGGRAGESAQ
ncbi:DUF6380 family protein [Streptomyces blattellae]|nr:DUF6380 family protein [Streptomyces blattellae]